MKERSFNDKIHIIGRITVIFAILGFVGVPIGLSISSNIPIDYSTVMKNGIPVFLIFAISAVCENLSYAPLIGSGALYMACVTGNVGNMKIPAAINAMKLSNCQPGTPKADVHALLAVAVSSFVTTLIVFLGMLFLAPIFAPIYNNEFLKPAFENLLPALFGALLFPYIKSCFKQAIISVGIPIILVPLLGRKFFSSNQSFVMMAVIILSVATSYWMYKKKILK